MPTCSAGNVKVKNINTPNISEISETFQNIQMHIETFVHFKTKKLKTFSKSKVFKNLLLHPINVQILHQCNMGNVMYTQFFSI